MLTIPCPHCGQDVQVADLLEAAKVTCGHCSRPLYGAAQPVALPQSRPSGRLSLFGQVMVFALLTALSGSLFFTLSPRPAKRRPGVADSRKRELLFFTMHGCRPCAGMKESLKAPTVKAALSDWDVRFAAQHAAETREHGVRGFPTLVAEVGGREVGRIVGMRSPEQLKDWLDGL
jgi:hypothetical protein